ncbi:hypothetical protein M407DRAFT_246841 [Tulasnella calospora MUT 4182]|uniref:Uncharacterized protein n=1 Tax=Tulasnella calospora MUT 4182 TaxID=1051891 RepID=A0A0C3Q2N7_9AGAM|nr:hypothetical protein M407DRAFT_246841 [Tulasnella calospora MUT 4182]
MIPSIELSETTSLSAWTVTRILAFCIPSSVATETEADKIRSFVLSHRVRCR